MKTNIRILILEHDPNDIGLLQYELKKSGLDYVSEIVQTKQDYENALTTINPDIILSDYSLPSFDGLSAFRIKQDISPETPFIIVSGTIGEENAVELIKMGVTDYALKDKLFQVVPKIKRALNEAADRRGKEAAQLQLKLREEQLQKIMDLSLDVICTLDEEGRFVTVGAASRYVWGYTPEELIGKRAIDFSPDEDKERVSKALVDLKRGIDMVNFDRVFIGKGGRPVTMFWSARWDANEKLEYSIAKDATEIKRAENKIKNNEKRFRTLLQNSTDGLALLAADGTVIERSPAALKLLELDPNEVSGRFRLDLVHPEDLPIINEACAYVMSDPGNIRTLEFRLRRRNGDYKWIELILHNQLEEPAVGAVVLNFRDITERKIAELALQTSEASLKEAQAIGHIGNFEENFLDGTTMWSDEMFRMLGIEKDKVKPSFELFTSFIHPDDRSGVLSEIARANEYLEDGTVDFRILRPDGEVLYVTHEWHFGYDEKGTPVRLFGIQQDITERMLAELAIRESEERLREAQAIGRIGNWEADMITGSAIWSDEIYRTYGVDKKTEASLETLFSLIHPEDRSDFTTKLNSIISSKEGVSTVFRIIRPDGEVRYIYTVARCKFDDKGNLVKVFGIQQDVTERRIAEIALEKSEQKYHDLFNLSPTPMWLFDVKTLRFLDVNEAAVKNYGYSREEFLNLTLKDIRPEEGIPVLESVTNTFAKSRAHFSGTVKHRRKNGEIFDVEIRNNVLEIEGRTVRLVLATDVSERVKHIQAIEEQNARLREIAWTQSHIVRAPLARMMGLVNLLDNKYNPKKVSTEEVLRYIVNSANELDEIIREIVTKTEQISNLDFRNFPD